MNKHWLKSQFDQTFERFTNEIIRYCFIKVSDYELAEDIASEVFIKYWRHLSQSEQIQNHRAYLYTIAHGLVVDHYRKKAHEKSESIENYENELTINDNSHIEFEQKEVIQEVLSKLNGIKAEYKEVILLHYIEDLSFTEIAQILDKKEGAVRVLLHRALESLKKSYE